MSCPLPENRYGIRARLASDSGFAVPVVMMSVLVALALGTVTVMASVNTQSSTIRDERAKQALAAAEAGVQQALLRYNRIRAQAPNVCVAGSAAMTSQPPSTVDNWCEPVAGSVTGNPGATFTYRVCPRGRDEAIPCPTPTAAHNITSGESASAIEIVSTGTVDGVSRRVEVVARSSGGDRPFAGNAGVIGLDSIEAVGTAQIHANVATNGDITLLNQSDIFCDSAYVGVGHGINGASQATSSCEPTQGSTSLPPVIQGDVPTNNSNSRWYNGSWFPLDPMTPACSSTCWNPDSRQLNITSGASRTLTLGGSNYSVCKLTLGSNSNLYVQSGADVRIYFDAPENCPGLPVNSDGCYQQLDVTSNARIAATGTGKIALLFVGSDALPTCATFSSNTDANQTCDQDFVAYGPRTDMRFASNSSFCGAIAGKSVFVDSNSTLRASNASADFELPSSVAGHYGVERFVECAVGTAATTPPNSGC